MTVLNSTTRLESYRTTKLAREARVGRIPAHWKEMQVRYATHRVTDGAHVSPDTSSGDFPFVSTVNIKGASIDLDNCLRTSRSSFTYMKKTGCVPRRGDVLFSKDGTVGTTAVVNTDRDFAVASSLVIISPRSSLVEPRWLHYWLNSSVIKSSLDSLLAGTALRRISVEKTGRLPLLLPPTTGEQQAIADFLDRETARIDALIDKKRRLIELLEEKRTALITRAVTKGLDPDVEMKDTGVEWLGVIPAHWEVRRNKALFREVDDRSLTGEEELLSVSHLTGVTRRSEKNVTMIEAESHEGYKLCRSGDLVVNTLWGWMGALGVAREEGMVSPAYHVYRPSRALSPRFVDYAVRSPRYVCDVTRHSKGVWKSRLRIYPDDFFEVLSVVPPRNEQEALADWLDAEVQRIAEVIGVVTRAQELLLEKRSALISAAVTGKIDVRNAA